MRRWWMCLGVVPLLWIASCAVASAQASYEETARDLTSRDVDVRLRALRLLKEAAYPEAAEPIGPLLADSSDEVQFEAVAAELNIFLAEKIVPRRRVGYVIEVRNKVAAEAAFLAGPNALSGRPVPLTVLTALRAAVRDDNPGVGLEALYAFGALAPDCAGVSRRDLLRASGPELASLVGSSDPAFRLAAVRVIARSFARRAQDPPVEPTVGDAVIAALNDRDRAIRGAAAEAIGAMRYDRAVQAMTQLFEYYGRGSEAVAALGALARIGHPSSASLFVSLLTSKDAALRALSIDGLGRIGDRSRLAAIQAVLTDERSDMVMLAANFASARLTNGAFDVFVEALGRPSLRDQALIYLSELAPGHVANFGRYAQDPDARIRTDIADILGAIRDPSARPIVEPMQKDANPAVARAATRAVARLQP